MKIDRALHSNTDFFENRMNPDPLAVQLVNSINSLRDIRYFGDNFFPTHLIFFDETISIVQIRTFTGIMKMEDLKGHDRYMQKLEFRKVAIEMCSPSNLTRIFVSDFYSYDHMPGYLTIPFNFNYKDLISYYVENKVELIRVKNRVYVYIILVYRRK